MRLRFVGSYVIAVLALCGCGGSRRAPAWSPADCRKATDSLASRSGDYGSWDYVAECAAVGAAALGAAIRSSSLVTDTTFLRGIVETATRVQSPQVFAASLDVMRDRGATHAARLAALLVLYAQRDSLATLWRIQDTWSSLSTRPRGSACGSSSAGSHAGYTYSERMPAGYLVTLADALDDIATDPSNVILRDLARCGRVGMLHLVPR